MSKPKPGLAAWLPAYLRVCADIVGLPQWDVQYDPDQTLAPESLAETRVKDHQHAWVGFCDGFAGFTPTEQRRLVAHELTHLWFTRLGGWHEFAAGQLAPAAQAPWTIGTHDEIEVIVQGLARVLERLLPLPPGGPGRG